MIPTPGIGKLLCITRCKDGVIARTTTSERKLFPLDPFVRGFPFFLFDGSIAAIELKEWAILQKPRVEAECVACQLVSATCLAVPCHHLLYCSECLEQAKVRTKADVCPLCGQRIASVSQVLLK